MCIHRVRPIAIDDGLKLALRELERAAVFGAHSLLVMLDGQLIIAVGFPIGHSCLHIADGIRNQLVCVIARIRGFHPCIVLQRDELRLQLFQLLHGCVVAALLELVELCFEPGETRLFHLVNLTGNRAVVAAALADLRGLLAS